ILRPRARAERDGVEVAGEAERRLRIRSAGARNDARAPRLVLVVGDAEAHLLEQRAGLTRAVRLAARWVDRVEGKERAGERDGVGGAHERNDKPLSRLIDSAGTALTLAAADGGHAYRAREAHVRAVGDEIERVEENLQRRRFRAGEPGGKSFRRHVERTGEPLTAADSLFRLGKRAGVAVALIHARLRCTHRARDTDPFRPPRGLPYRRLTPPAGRCAGAAAR